MGLSKEEHRWVGRNAKFWQVPVPQVVDDERVHDIAYSPQAKTILLGKLFQRSNPRVRKKKLTHESLHHALGVGHEQAMRDVGYYSKPERDRLSERVVRKVEAMRNPGSNFETFKVKDREALNKVEDDWSHTFSFKPAYQGPRAVEIAQRDGILMITTASGEFIVFHTPDTKPHLLGPPYEKNPSYRTKPKSGEKYVAAYKSIDGAGDQKFYKTYEAARRFLLNHTGTGDAGVDGWVVSSDGVVKGGIWDVETGVSMIGSYGEFKNPLLGGLASGTRSLAKGMYQARVPADIRGLREELQDEKAKLRKAEALAIAMERKERDGRATKEELEEAYKVYSEFNDSVLSIQDEIAGYEQVTPFVRRNPSFIDLYDPGTALGRVALGVLGLILLSRFGRRG